MTPSEYEKWMETIETVRRAAEILEDLGGLDEQTKAQFRDMVMTATLTATCGTPESLGIVPRKPSSEF